MAVDKSYRQKLEKLAAEIRKASSVYVLTGAGMSTESGIPDFRSPGTGLWEKIDPMQYSTADVLRSNPVAFYEFGFPRFQSIVQAEPNPGHYALAEMEQLRRIKGVITQNIDGLHFKAGSKKVWEVHGHLRSARCILCAKNFPFQALVEKLAAGEMPPRCSCNGVLRPNVVLFGDPMDKAFYSATAALREGCDLMLVAGTSLAVYPVAALPQLAGSLAIINLQPTPYDAQAEVTLRDKCSRVLTDLLPLLKW